MQEGIRKMKILRKNGIRGPVITSRSFKIIESKSKKQEAIKKKNPILFNFDSFIVIEEI